MPNAWALGASTRQRRPPRAVLASYNNRSDTIKSPLSKVSLQGVVGVWEIKMTYFKTIKFSGPSRFRTIRLGLESEALDTVLPERRTVHVLEEPEDGAELDGGAVQAITQAFSTRESSETQSSSSPGLKFEYIMPAHPSSN